MRPILLLLIFIGTFTGALAQRNIKKALIVVDGRSVTYKEYEALDPSQFSEIKVLSASKEHVKLFGKKSRRGIVHLKSRKFLDDQKLLYDQLLNELSENRTEPILILNGIPVERTKDLKNSLLKLPYEAIEWIVLLDDTKGMNGQKTMIIQTNVTP
jgi:hypothetical protein